MAKSTKKRRKLTTSEALEQLLGRKAAKRLRQLANQLAKARERPKKSKKKR